MPFTFDGQWIAANNPCKGPKKTVKVRLIKRKQSVITAISNLDLTEKDMVELASNIKKSLGCGGSVKENTIELQGDKVDQVEKTLKRLGFL